MALGSGARLGVYEIIAPLGAGGMGEVYRARYTNLGRDIALKILPPNFAADSERVGRFRREAQLLAALNHPFIAAIYGFEEADGTQFLVLEFVAGETLAERLKRGPIPAADAIPIALQIAEALANAHDKGIIHRDLKPSNIALTESDQVKVLDFGLAKLATPSGAAGASALSLSPTLTTPALNTGVGTLLGTAAYMAPEQAKGREADKRCDVWAFGCVLFEMLTAQQAFAGEDMLDTLTAIMRAEPDWAALPPDVPEHIRLLLKKCLVKDRRLRLPDISVALYIMSEAPPPPTAAPAAARAPAAISRRRLAFAGAMGAIGGIVMMAAAWILTRPAARPSQPPTRFTLVTPAAAALAVQGADRDIAISADGSVIAYRASGGQLAVRRLDQLEPQLLDGGANVRGPFFSPDGHWIGFFEGADLRKVSTTGGPSVTICHLSGANPRGAVWGDDNVIVFATGDPTTGLLSVSSGGGDPKVLTKPDVTQHELDHLFPSVLPGGAILFTVTTGQVDASQIAVFDPKTGQRKTLLRGGTSAEYARTGHLVYAAGGTLRAVPFDVARLEVVGDPTPVVEHTMVSNFGAANFALSRDGTLVYVPGGAGGLMMARQLVWVDRRQQESALSAPARTYVGLRISPDGSRVALDVRDQENDIWVWELGRQTLTRLTFDPAVDSQPVWTPDGRRIVFSSTRSGVPNLFWRAADGTGSDERLTTSDTAQFPTSATPDGKYVIAYQVFQRTLPDVVRFPLNRSVSTPAPHDAMQPGDDVLVRTAYAEFNAEVSPDGRYLAYQSIESGQFEIYVRPYPNANDGRWQVSSGGGTRPAWARSGRELFFLDRNNKLTVVPVQTSGPTFTAGNPAKLFDTAYAVPLGLRSYDVSPDGQRFLMIKDRSDDEKASAPAIVVVERWFDDLRQRVPTR